MSKQKLVEHHTKYKELHGVDETVLMTNGEHKKLHIQLRKDKKCNVPVDELRKVSKLAHSRTKKSIETRRKYRNSEEGKRVRSDYNRSEHGKEVINKYIKNVQRICFSESQGLNTEFCEEINYNNKTGNITYSARFRGIHTYKVPVIDI